MMQETAERAEQENRQADAPGGSSAIWRNRAHIKTDGERKFDRKTYRDIGYYWNVAISLVAVYWAERTHSGQGFIKNLGAGFEKLGVNRNWAEYLGTKSFFLAGGFAVLAPMKWKEDKKPELVRQYNREIHGEKADSDPVILQSEKEVAEAPRQGWTSIFSSRALALVPFYLGYGLLWGHNSKLAEITKGKVYIDRPIAWASREIGALGAKIMGHKEALGQIAELKKTSPGVIRSLREFTSHPGHDPIHTTGPYYVISEFITSGMVAWGVYALTRITGPFFGKKDNAPEPVAQPTAPTSESAMPYLSTEKKPAKEPGLVVSEAQLAHAESRLAQPGMAMAQV